MSILKKVLHRGLKQKILLGYLSITLITLILSILSISNLISLKGAINDIMLENYRSVIAAEEMMDSLERQDSGELIYLFHQRQEGEKIFRENQVEFLKWLGRAEDNVTIEGEGALITNLEVEYHRYLDQYQKIRDLTPESADGAQELYFQEVLPHFAKVKSMARELLLMNQENMYNAQQRANKNTTEDVYSTLVFSIIAILLASLFGFYLSNQIIKPTQELTRQVIQIGEGNLDSKIEIQSSDEIGQLAREFNRMTDKLREYDEVNVQRLISEKRKSEAIVRSISSPLLVTDAENRLVLLNPASEELFNIQEESVLRKHILEVIKEEQVFDLIKSLEEADQEEGVRKTISLEGKNGTAHYQSSVVPVFNQNQELQLVVTILDDITQLKELDNLKSEFVSTVSHEFRTPLTSMNMAIGMLLQRKFGEINDKQDQLLATAKEDCERLKSLVNDLLDLSKIESGKIEMEYNPVEVGTLINAAVKPFGQTAEERQITIGKEFAAGLGVMADANKIIWVLTNLIGNALRYTPTEGKITVSAECKGSRVYVCVTDTGKGIPKEYQDKIFEKFVRVHSDEDDPGGTGLGLAISKEIVEAHGGRIWVTSQPDEGSTFTFTLKRAELGEEKNG